MTRRVDGEEWEVGRVLGVVVVITGADGRNILIDRLFYFLVGVGMVTVPPVNYDTSDQALFHLPLSLGQLTLNLNQLRTTKESEPLNLRKGAATNAQAKEDLC